MDSKHQRVKLSDGHFIPSLGYGTYKPQEVPNSKTLEGTKLAIDAGFRHIDTAHAYQVEEEVGLAIKSKIAEGHVNREDIFLTSKLWCTSHRPEMVKTSLESSLKKLGLAYVDLYLIHYPVAMKPGKDLFPADEKGKTLLDTGDICATWEAMEKCKDAGLAKSIGVSNFNCRQLEVILNKPGLKHKPVCNQVECHPYLNQSKLLEFCRAKDIVLVAYCALGSQREKRWVDPSAPALLEDPVLCAVAKKHQRSPAQVALRYQLQRGVVVLAQSFKEKEIKENMQFLVHSVHYKEQGTFHHRGNKKPLICGRMYEFMEQSIWTVRNVFEFQLTSEDMKNLDGQNRNFRYASADFLADDPNYPFSDEY